MSVAIPCQTGVAVQDSAANPSRVAQESSPPQTDQTAGTASKGMVLENARRVVARLSAELKDFTRAPGPNQKLLVMVKMNDDLLALRTLFALCGLPVMATFTLVLSRFIASSSRDLNSLSDSKIMTACKAVDFLARVLEGEADLAQSGNEPLSFLVVDDDAVSRKALSFALRLPGTKVECAESAEQAIKLLREHSFDAVFTDIMMPGLDGFGLTQGLKTLPNHTSTPFVYVTALSDLQTRSKAVLIGSYGLITKPFSPGEIALKALKIALQARLPGRLSLD